MAPSETHKGVTEVNTLAGWIGDITERRRTVRKVKALLLSQLGWSNYQIADYLDIAESSVRNDVNDNISAHLAEDVLRDALDGLPPDFLAVLFGDAAKLAGLAFVDRRIVTHG